ncbi:MAG: c-type cytochrome, partial [Candidatus Binatia bacterium]
MTNKTTEKAKFSNLRPKLLLLLIFSLGCLITVVSACGSETATPAPSPTPAPTLPPTPTLAPPTPVTAEDGRTVFIVQACVGCHTVQGIPEAQGKVGPELTHFASNSLIAGVLPNSEENLRKWLKDPPAVKPGTL